MLVKYMYIFDVIIFVTSLCSCVKNIKGDKTLFNSVISIFLGVFGVIIANFTYSIWSSNFNEIWTLAILAIIEFIEILLLFKQKNLKSVMASLYIPIIITFAILYTNQLDIQSLFNYNIDANSNTVEINGFSYEYYKESRAKIPKYVVKGLKFYKVTSISEKSFYECKDLYDVKLPNSIKNIGNYAFAECKNLHYINIPNDLETLGARAFYNTELEDNIKLDNDIKLYDYLNDYLIRDNKNANFELKRKYYGFEEGLCVTKIGFIDNTGNVKIDNANYIRNFSEGLAPAYKDKKYGFIDVNGNVIIDFKYDKVYDFSEGLACVEKDGKFGFINKKGETVIDFQYDDPSIRSGAYIYGKDFGLFINGIACVKKDGKFGYIDTKGNVLVDYKFYFGYHFYNERALTSEGFIDKNGNIVIDDTNYTTAKGFSEGLAIAKKGGKYGYINTNGEVVVDFKYDSAYKFAQGLAVVEKGGKYGYIDKNGKIVIDYQFDYADEFLNGLASVRKNGKYGYINNKGEVVIDFQFDNAYNFSEGFALVEKDGKYQFINKNGETIIDKIEVNELIFSEN